MNQQNDAGKKWMTGIWALAVSIVLCLPVHAARIKDLAGIKGVRSNQLTGYGLVVGLSGTGDNSSVVFTRQSLTNMMEKMNIHFDKSELSVKNVAAVMLTASIPPFAKIGDTIDVTASSLGDAKSLKGGTLLLAPLKGVDGNIYAIAQGLVSVSTPGSKGGKAHLQTARLVQGASIEREIPFRLDGKKQLTLSLTRPDFTTARRVADTINAAMGEGTAKLEDASSVKLNIPEDMQKANVAEFIADVERLNVVPDTRARVIVNERTGTVVIGSEVSLSRVAVAHGDLNVVIDDGGDTPEEESLMQLPGASTIGDLVNGLNALGVKPVDLISILQSIKAAGALQADLEII